MIIAVDGPAASGKGTIARRLAAHFDYAYLDTGTLYRAVGLGVLRTDGDPNDADAARVVAENLSLDLLDGDELRSGAVGAAASKVAAVPAVRAALLAFQHAFAAHPPGGEKGAVLDGRDIGTVICPDAAHKFFVTAELEIRAQRRFKELIERGETVIYARVLEDLRERDARDAGRTDAPMARAPDAWLIDTSELTPDQATAQALARISS
jgi:cytidylate kinase